MKKLVRRISSKNASNRRASPGRSIYPAIQQSSNPTSTHSSCSVWEARYQTKDMPWEKGEASPGLVDFLEAHSSLRRGKVCVTGCGTGHDVRAWANSGFQATGYDLAPSA